MYIDSKEKSFAIVEKLYSYMLKEGLSFSSSVIQDGSPYALLADGSSISYRKRPKLWNNTGIVLFCSSNGVYKDKLVKNMGLKAQENPDNLRPYAIFIPDDMFERAVEIIK